MSNEEGDGVLVLAVNRACLMRAVGLRNGAGRGGADEVGVSERRVGAGVGEEVRTINSKGTGTC